MNEIWSYNSMQNVPQSFRLTLNEGNTPIRKIDINGLAVMIKDENANPNGSFKDRSLAYQLSYHIASGKRKFVISSSGNAAVSAAAYAGLAGVELDVFVAEKVNPLKLEKLSKFENGSVRIHQSAKPKSDAVKFASEEKAFNLRGSQDEAAVTGFKTIAYEICKQYPEVSEVFIPCSSGTSTVGIAKGFNEHKKAVKIFICQTSKIHSIAKTFDHHFVSVTKSFADAITDRVAHRKNEVVDIVKKSGGGGFVVNDALLYQAEDIVEKQGLSYSYNSLLSLAGLLKAQTQGIELLNPVVIASGL